MIDEYEGVITMTADFARNTVRGCIGCEGDLVTRRAHLGIFLGDEVRDVQSIAADYELHLGEAPFDPNGTFDHLDVTVKHPERTVIQSEGGWGGSLSNIPDQEGNPRLAAGFSDAVFEESDGSVGLRTDESHGTVHSGSPAQVDSLRAGGSSPLRAVIASRSPSSRPSVRA